MRIIKKAVPVIIICLFVYVIITGFSDRTGSDLKELAGRLFGGSGLSSGEDLNLRSSDGTYYTFTYKGEDYDAEFHTDTWTVYNSYRIKNPADIRKICKALSEEHPVPGRDRESFRTPRDMAFEWEQHNLAYSQLPEDSHWRESSRNVDLDPDDQGKTFKEIYEERTGKKLDLDTVVEHKNKITEKIKEKLDQYDDSEDADFDQLMEKIKRKIKEHLKDE